MKNQKIDGVEVWKQTEDLLIPQLPLDLAERAVYYHLLRHSHLEGKPRLRLYERNRTGHLVDVRLPGKIRAIAAAAHTSGKAELEKVNFLQTRPLREGIHSRERGLCFYCSRRLSPRTRCLDHVIPRVHSGGNSYRNLVSCCGECNSLKAERSAENFLRWLFRQGRIDSAKLTARRRSLMALAAGKLRPRLKK